MITITWYSQQQWWQLIGLDNNNDNNNNYNYNYGTGLPHDQGYYNDDDRSTDEGKYRIKPGQ